MTRLEMRAWRDRLGLSQEMAGEILGVTSRAVAKWEAGEAPIDKRTELATQRYEQRHITIHGINGLPLLYTVHVRDASDNKSVDETYLVVARQDHEANKLVYSRLGKPSCMTLTSVAVAKASPDSELRVIGTVAELTRVASTRAAPSPRLPTSKVRKSGARIARVNAP